MASFFISKYSLKNKEIRFRAVITHGGKNLKSKTFRRKSDARTWANNYVLRLEQQEATGEKPCNVVFKTLCDEYLEYAYKVRLKDHDRPRIVLVWRNIFRDTLLNEINADLIRDKLTPRKKQKPATYNKHRSTLAAIFNFAVDEKRYIRKNPVHEIKSLPMNNKIVRFLSDEEKSRLLKAAQQIGEKFYLAILLSLTTGMRKSEVMNLRWNHIDFNRGVAILSDTKNGEERHSPIPDITMTELKKYRGIGDALIFPSDVNFHKPFDFRKQFTLCLKMAAVEGFRWHDMRHSCASIMAMSGATLLEIGAVLGHKSPTSTSRYAHLSTDHKSKVLNNVMDKSFGGQF